MKIKIDKTGMLAIQRRGSYRLMICPFSEGENYCGDWCPLFAVYQNSDEFTELRLCQRTYQVDGVIEERD